MALKNCEDCGYEISTNADSCPNCGRNNDVGEMLGCGFILYLLNIFYLNVFSGIPIVFSITLASLSLFIFWYESDSFRTKEGSFNYKYIYIASLSLLSVIVLLIIYVYQVFTWFIGYEKSFYDLIYEFREMLLGLYFLLPLLWNAFLYYGDTFYLDGVPGNPYTPLEDKNLLIKNIIELSGKTSWEDDLEKLDIEALNDIHEKLNRHRNE